MSLRPLKSDKKQDTPIRISLFNFIRHFFLNVVRLSSVKNGVLLFLTLICLIGCNKRLSGTSSASGVTDINTVPDTFEPGFDLEKTQKPKKQTEDSKPDGMNFPLPPSLPEQPSTPPEPPAPQAPTIPSLKPFPAPPTPGSPSQPQKKPQPVKPAAPAVTSPRPVTTSVQASRIIYYAQKVIETEARKLGTACNRFLLRVLSLSGFANENFLANNFHVYAKKNFTDAVVVNFRIDNNGDSLVRLKKHLWSYPERTPFILQWVRGGGHGHVAILERIQDKLVIYQASLNSQYPNKKQTLIQALLNSRGRTNLIVYSEMKATPAKSVLAVN
jgi:hypothetical protein